MAPACPQYVKTVPRTTTATRDTNTAVAYYLQPSTFGEEVPFTQILPGPVFSRPIHNSVAK
jgi:hypothetical protein